MAHRPASRRAQRGVALMALLAVAVMVFAYVLTSRLNAASRFVGIDREHNATVLARAKRALIGYMAQRASLSTENNPGRLPCPEAPAFFGDPAQEGIAAGNCTLPAVGRLPWRTLGIEMLVDAAGEPLWYAVSPGWALPSAGATLTINSDSMGQLSLEGAANDAVALIVAPGPAMTVLAGGTCTAWSQSRPVTGPPDLRNYLECGNTTGNFVTNSPGNTFNDQVLRVAAADVIPALEAAVADRMQREIAPALRSVYGSAQWGTSAGNPLYPFAARFDSPHPGTSQYLGEDGRYQGLLPFNSSSATCGADPRCTTSFVSWNTAVAPTVSISGEISGSGSCTFPTPTTARCTGSYLAITPVTLRMTVRANNVAMALRQLDPSKLTIEYGLLACGSAAPGTGASAVLQSNGSAVLTLEGTAPGLVGLTLFFCMTADLGVLSDHPLLDPTSTGPGSTGWFVRNEWYRLVYYAAAQESTADGLPAHGCDSTDCLRFNGASPRNIRALLVLAGRCLSLRCPPATRPSNDLADYLEYQNADLGTLYEQRLSRASKVGMPAINAPFNDRLILVDWITPNPTFPVATLP
jgi:hypothetical protein